MVECVDIQFPSSAPSRPTTLHRGAHRIESSDEEEDGEVSDDEQRQTTEKGQKQHSKPGSTSDGNVPSDSSAGIAKPAEVLPKTPAAVPEPKRGQREDTTAGAEDGGVVTVAEKEREPPIPLNVVLVRAGGNIVFPKGCILETQVGYHITQLHSTLY